MKTCNNCGNPLQEGQKFCSNCGCVLQQSTDNQANNQDKKTKSENPPEYVGNSNQPSTPVRKRRHTALGIISFILSFTFIFSPIGVILAVIDLIKNKGRKHGLSIAALIIGGVIILIIALAKILSNCSVTGHKWADATCTEPMTCTACGETEGEALGHAWVNATCTKPKTCERCGKTEGKALGHDWKEATCTEPKTCNRCGKMEGEQRHVVNDWTVTEEASCAKTGTEVGTCEVCGKEQTRVIEKLPHDFGEWKTVKEATCSEKGVENRVCKQCNTEETRDIPTKEHQGGVWEYVKEATYTDGGTRVIRCMNCGKELKREDYQLTEEEKIQWLKENCQADLYTDIARSPDKYTGQYVKFDCYILQIVDEAQSKWSVSSYRAATKGRWDDVIYLCVDNYGSGVRILEDDRITVYGIFDGLVTYTTVLGASVTIPKIIALHYE